jgi:hypothetical protein
MLRTPNSKVAARTTRNLLAGPQGRSMLALPLLAGLEILNRRITSPPQGCIDPVQHNVVNFDPFVEGDLAQGLVDGFWQVDARMDDGCRSVSFRAAPVALVRVRNGIASATSL